MAQFPINIQSFPLSSGVSDLTFWRCDFKSGAWTAPVKLFDLGTAPTFVYNQTSGATLDGTNIGTCIAHSTAFADLGTLQSIGDGPPDPQYDVSAGNTLTTPSANQSTGEWKYKGNWYEVVTELTTPSVHIRKSINNRATWNELDAANAPSGSVPKNFTTVTRASAVRRCLWVPNKIDLFCTNNIGGGQTRFFLYSFDLDTETWTGPYGIQDINNGADGVLNAGQNSGQAFWNFSDGIVRFANGDLAGFIQGASTGQSYYFIFSGGVWGTGIPVGDTTDTIFQAIVDPASPETMWVWTSKFRGKLRYYKATHGGVVTGPLFTVSTTGSFGGIGHGVCMSGVLWVPVTDSDDASNAVYTGAAGGALTKSPLPIPPPDVGFPPNAGSYMVDWVPGLPPNPSPPAPVFPPSPAPFNNPQGGILIYPVNYRELDTAAQIAAAPPIRTSYTGRLIATDHTRKWTRWNVPAVGAALMYRVPGKLEPIFYFGGNVYALRADLLTDDDLGLIVPYYTTYFFVTHDAEMGLMYQDAGGERQPLGSGRKLLAYLKAYIAAQNAQAPGTCQIVITPFVDNLQNPWALIGLRTLVNKPKFDIEWPGGQAQGDRIALQFWSTPITGTDNGFSLQRLTAFLKRAQRLQIRGAN